MRLALLWAPLLSPVRAWHTSGNRVLDAHGRERFWRGVNLVYKSAPYAPRLDAPDLGLYRLSFTDADAQLLRSLGLNIARLAVMWPGVEPVRGQYNETYLGEIRRWVRLLARHGVDVVLEFHQDALAEMFCGEGLPVWAASNEELLHARSTGFPWPVNGVTAGAWPMLPVANATGVFASARVPSRKDCASHSWGDYLGSYAMLKNVHQLYTNDGDKKLRDAFAQYWAKVAASLSNESNVVGYEVCSAATPELRPPRGARCPTVPLTAHLCVQLLNEPPPLLSVYSFPGALDGKFLQPFYDAVAAKIRQADPSQVRWFTRM
jgi:endoglycosylceramidase